MTGVSRARLEEDYRHKKLAIRQDPALTWEQKERAIKALGDEYHARLRETEREAGAA